MSYMFEVYYRAPIDPVREAALTERVSSHGGRMDYRETSHHGESESVCLTFEFSDLEQAQDVAESLRRQGEHVEGPVDYGP